MSYLNSTNKMLMPQGRIGEWMDGCMDGRMDGGSKCSCLCLFDRSMYKQNTHNDNKDFFFTYFYHVRGVEVNLQNAT